jgi:hypothetical protein
MEHKFFEQTKESFAEAEAKALALREKEKQF